MAISSAEKSRKYRAKDVEAYRRRKAAYARTNEQRAIRRAYMSEWRAKNRDKHNAWSRAYHAANREQILIQNRRAYLKKKYGITPEIWDAIFDKQNGKCAICSTRAFKSWGAATRPHVDHCHITGSVRGLLCTRCNSALGWFEAYKQSVLMYLNAAEAEGKNG